MKAQLALETEDLEMVVKRNLNTQHLPEIPAIQDTKAGGYRKILSQTNKNIELGARDSVVEDLFRIPQWGARGMVQW